MFGLFWIYEKRKTLLMSLILFFIINTLALSATWEPSIIARSVSSSIIYRMRLLKGRNEDGVANNVQLD